MKIGFRTFIFIICNSYLFAKAQHTMSQKEVHKQTAYYYLALGDSYTIGEQVALQENFPNQVYKLLQADLPGVQPPRIIAKTGWTTDELEAGIQKAASIEPLRPAYDFVSLLIGVNNQFRGQSLSTYRLEFEKLLKEAIHFAGDKADHVIVISIPDWSHTPFGKDYDRNKVAVQIDSFNQVNKEISENYSVRYLDITPWTREGLNDPSLVAADGLHPSSREYARWAEKIAEFFRSKH